VMSMSALLGHRELPSLTLPPADKKVPSPPVGGS
jgi:hypothetical protein